MQINDELRVLVEAEVARAIENFKKLSEGVDESEKKTQSLGDALDSLSKKSLIISGVLGGAGIAAVKFAGENEKLKLSLKNMLGSAEEADAVFKDWRRLGTSPGLSVDEVSSLGKALINMGKDTQYVSSTIEMLGNIAAGTGASFSEISSSFERARAMGSLTTRDLVRLQQQGIPIVKQLAKELGTSEESVKKLAAEGRLSFADLERSFRSMSAPGGQFAGMMDELSGTVLETFSSTVDDAKQALAAFGETLIPIATDLLNVARNVLQGITNMDDGTKRFVLGMGGVIAISGPVISAIKGINAAMTAMAANPYILAIGGTIAAVGVVAGLISKHSNDMEKAAKDYEASISRIARSNRDLLQSGSFEEVCRQIRGMTKDMYNAARETGNFEAAVAAAERVYRLNQQLKNLREQADQEAGYVLNRAQALISILETPVDPNAESWLSGYISEIEKFEDFMAAFTSSGYSQLAKVLWENTEGWAEACADQNMDAMLQMLKNVDGRDPAKKAEIDRIFNEIQELMDGKTINPFDNADLAVDIKELKKRWQDWFGEITKIDPDAFGDSGARAAELYIADFERVLTAQTTIADVLGEQLDIAGVLKSRQDEVQKALVELLSIDPDQIDIPFTVLDQSIQRLVEEYKKLEAAKNEAFLTDTLNDLDEAVKNLGKDQYDLVLIKMMDANATREQIEAAEKMIETLRRYGESFEDFLTRKIASGLMDIFPELEKQAADAIANISTQLSMMSFDGLLNGLSAVGEAWARNEKAAESLKQAMAQMAQQILNQLPMMFLQAGLQLIAQGQWPLGLGFIAAAGSSAIISGYVKETIDKETANAHGNVYGSVGMVPYAHGGSFTNQIVNQPTHFRYGGSLGVMGEAGPEAIMPLKRMPSGNLGVEVGGTGANVIVTINNYSGEPVKKEETTDADGNRQINIDIGEMINSHLTSGKADRAMTRFGVRSVGV